MKDIWKKCLKLYKKYREIVNYLVVGGIGTVVSIATFEIFMLMNLGSVVSNIISWVIVVILMYVLNRKFVFEEHASEKKAILTEIAMFFSARILTLLLETAIVYTGIDLLGFNSVIVKTFGQITVIVLNYIASKLVIFRKKN